MRDIVLAAGFLIISGFGYRILGRMDVYIQNGNFHPFWCREDEKRHDSGKHDTI